MSSDIPRSRPDEPPGRRPGGKPSGSISSSTNKPTRKLASSKAGTKSGEALVMFELRSREIRRTPLKRFFAEVIREIIPGASANCLITGDDELRRLNREFLGKDYPTDVLSFPASSSASKAEGFAGDLAISLDRAREQAAQHGHTIEEEISILMLHGSLHLAGMDHETDRGQMARTEQRWRAHFGLPSALIERQKSARRHSPNLRSKADTRRTIRSGQRKLG